MTTPPTMRAARVHALTGIDGVRLSEAPVPAPGPGELLVRVEAAGLSLADLLLASGRYQAIPPLPFTIGMDLAGTVAAVGEGVQGFSPGDRVTATGHEGAAAEYALTDPRLTFPLPDRISFTEGAACGINYLTAHYALAIRAQTRPGETVLVHGAAGGVGTACLQIAKALGARTIGVVSSDEKARFAAANGADEVVRVDGFKDAVLEATEGRGVDVVVDTVGGDATVDSLRALARYGRLMVVGFARNDPPTVKLNRLLLSNTDVRGVGWSGFAEEHDDNARRQWEQLLPLFASGALRPAVGREVPLDDVVDGLRALDERRALGKVVVRVAPSGA